jgi:hypothetical protein
MKHCISCLGWCQAHMDGHGGYNGINLDERISQADHSHICRCTSVAELMARHRERSRRMWARTQHERAMPPMGCTASILRWTSSSDIDLRTRVQSWRRLLFTAAFVSQAGRARMAGEPLCSGPIRSTPAPALQACSGSGSTSALVYSCSWTSRFKMPPQRVWVKHRAAELRCAMSLL